MKDQTNEEVEENNHRPKFLLSLGLTSFRHVIYWLEDMYSLEEMNINK